FQTAGDGVGAFAALEGVCPAETQLLNGRALRFGADIFARIGSAVGLAERVPAGNERNGLLVIHRHASERFADIARRGDWVGLSIGPLRIHVNQSHLNSGERIIELTIAAVALVPQPGALRPPEDVLFGLPDIHAPAAETEGLEPHRLQCDVTGKDPEVGPGDFPAILLLDRPEQPARLIEARIVRPAIEWRKTLCAGACPAAAVADAVRTRAVPRHTNEKWPIVAIVGRPPIL